MANERLGNAMEAAHVSIEAVARVTEVDPKTVQRWLKGRIPHPRHRWKVAELVHERADFIWPPDKHKIAATTAKTSEIVAAYAHRADVPPDAWWQLFLQAKEHIDLLGYAMQFLP
jgi:transcriptional regulator with XRE-family HTH domain